MSFTELILSIGNTLFVLGLVCALALPCGTLLALLLVRTDVYGRRWAWIALGSQLAVPLYVMAGGWNAGFGLQGWLREFGLAHVPWGAVNVQSDGMSILAVSCIHAFAALPWVTLTLALGLLWTVGSQEDQALLDGGVGSVFTRVLLPKLKFWFAASAMLCVLPVMTEMVVSNLYQVSTVAELVYLDASRGMIQPVTYTLASMLCIGPVALGFLWLLRGASWQQLNYQAAQSETQTLRLGPWRAPCSALVWGLVLFLVGLPIISLIAKAGWKPFTTAEGVTGYGWGFGRFARTWVEAWSLHGSEFYWSILLATVSTGAAFATACVLYALTLRGGRWTVSCLTVLCLAMPGPLVGSTLAWLLNRSEPEWLGLMYDQTLLAPVLAQQFRLLPMAWLLVHCVIRVVPPSAWEQAKVDGLRSWDLFRSVVWPSTWRLWLASGALLFALSVGELSCSMLVLPPGVTTVAKRLFELLHFGMRHQDSGLCGILMGWGWCVSLLIWWALQGSARKSFEDTADAI